MKLLILRYPIEDAQKVIEFDEIKYAKENNCSVANRKVHVTEKFITVTFELGAKFQVAVA